MAPLVLKKNKRERESQRSTSRLTAYVSPSRQHDVIPDNEDLLAPITHVALAFLRSDVFLDDARSEWPLFRSVGSTRNAFLDADVPAPAVLVAIGGWGDNGFSVAARTDTSRKAFAQNVARMVETTGADGMLRRVFLWGSQAL